MPRQPLGLVRQKSPLETTPDALETPWSVVHARSREGYSQRDRLSLSLVYDLEFLRSKSVHEALEYCGLDLSPIEGRTPPDNDLVGIN